MTEIVRIVEDKGLANTMKSGSLPVLATPQMAAWMEEAACLACADRLQEGQTSVGIELHISHNAPSPAGAEIRIRAELTGVKKDRILFFHVEAWMNDVCIGKGEHTRCIVEAASFMNQLQC